MVYRLALHDCRNVHDAEDVMQNVFLRLCKSAPDFESGEHARRWLIRVTVNECKRLFVSPWKKRIELPGEWAAEWPGEEGSGASGNAAAAAETPESQVLEAVLRLPRKYRILIYLFYYEEYPAADIAKLLGRKVSTVQTQMQRARKQLKRMLEEVGFYGA